MAISDKLTYLNTTKGKIKDAINLTNANILSEDTFRSYAEKLKLGLVDIINNGTDDLYNSFPKTTGAGAEIALNGTYEAPMKLNEIDGDTLQDGTPTPDNPVEIESVTGRQEIEICGKNLFDKDKSLDNYYYTASGETAIYNKNQFFNKKIKPLSNKITISYTNRYNLQNGSSIIAYVRIVQFDSNNNFISRLMNNNNNYTFTLDNNTAYFILCVDNGTDAYFENLQIEQGSTATTYEPYQSQEYDINLGKNLLNIPDGSYTQNGINIDVVNGKITINGTATASTNIKISNLKITKEGTYTISPNINTSSYGNNLQLGGYVYNSDGSYKENIDIRSANKTKTISNGEYITNFWVYILNGTTFNNFEVSLQLEKGPQATSYSSYFTPIEFCGIGNYKDKLRKSTGKNLFNKDNKNILNAYFESSGGQIISNNNNRVFYIPCKKNTTYSISQGPSSLSNHILGVATTNVKPQAGIIVYDFIEKWGLGSFAYTTNDTAKYLVFRIRVADDVSTYWNGIQIEEGSQATDIEPFGKDVWYKYKKIGKVVFDGSEFWGYSSYTHVFYTTSITDYATSNNIPYSIYYKGVNNVNGAGDMVSENNNVIGFINISGGTTPRFYIKDTRYTNASDTPNLKSWLSTHNTEVYYALATPTYEAITNEELINQLELLYNAKSHDGTTTISIRSEDLPMILNVSALSKN